MDLKKRSPKQGVRDQAIPNYRLNEPPAVGAVCNRAQSRARLQSAPTGGHNAHRIFCFPIKVLADLERSEARLAIDMQVLMDLKKRFSISYS